MQITRREIMRAAGLSVIAAGAGAQRAKDDAAIVTTTRPAPAPAEFRKQLLGPILSIPTPFTKDFQLDHASVRTMIQAASRAGVEIFALTSGDGQYQWLRYEEIKALTKTMTQAAAGKGITIAAAASWATDQVVDYARYAESVGASAVQVLLPETSDEAAILEHYRAVARSTALPIVLHGNFSVALLEKLVKIESIAALKEDITLDYYINRQRQFGHRLSLFGGGTEYRFLVGHPYGSPAYYSAYAAFAPFTAMQFWNAILQDDTRTAYDWAQKYDHPFLDHWSHGFWHASLEHFGTGLRYLRPPMSSFTDAQMKEVKAFYDGLGLMPGPNA